MAVTDAVWASRWKLYFAEVDKNAVAGLWTDLSKAYENVHYHCMEHALASFGAPKTICTLLTQMYSAPRCIMVNNIVSEEVKPWRGIIAGCPFGVGIMNLVTSNLMEYLSRLGPQLVETRLWVDDIYVCVCLAPQGKILNIWKKLWVLFKNGQQELGAA